MLLGNYLLKSSTWRKFSEKTRKKLETDWDNGNGTFYGTNVSTLIKFFEECTSSNVAGQEFTCYENVRTVTKLPNVIVKIVMSYFIPSEYHVSVGMIVKSYGIWDKCYAYPFKWLFKHMGLNVEVYKNDVTFEKEMRGGCSLCGYGGTLNVVRELPHDPYNVIVWTNNTETVESFKTKRHWMVNAYFYGKTKIKSHRSTYYVGKKNVLK
jgi:hypothetical protein